MSSTPDERDGRSAPRLRTLKGATIVFNNAASLINCVVRDLSLTGARLRVEGAATIPNRFMLVIGSGGGRQEWAAKVVWRSADELGVAFD